MGEAASVESIDALLALRRAIFKFIDSANAALTDAESEVYRTLTWLEGEQQIYWQHQLRKRTELAARCREAVREKKLFKDSAGRQQSAIDEEKALARALQAQDEAEQKLANVRKYRIKLQREITMYKGQVQRLTGTVQQDMKSATAELDRMVQTLQGYVSLNVGDAAPDVAVSQADTTTQATSAPPPQGDDHGRA